MSANCFIFVARLPTTASPLDLDLDPTGGLASYGFCVFVLSMMVTACNGVTGLEIVD